jgi:hypothetical protein
MYIHFGFEKIADLLINSPNISMDRHQRIWDEIYDEMDKSSFKKLKF